MDVEDAGDGDEREASSLTLDFWHEQLCILWPTYLDREIRGRHVVGAIRTIFSVEAFQFEMLVNHPTGDFQRELAVKDWCIEREF